MIQNVNQALAEKFKVQFSQVFLYGKIKWQLPLTLMRQRNAVSAQRAVTDTTNDLHSKCFNVKAKRY